MFTKGVYDMKKKINALVMPVVKWVGGKRQLLDELKKYTPSRISTYYEPFFGGGANLFAIQPKNAVINDLNGDLVTTYRVIKEKVEELIEKLKVHEANNTEEYFYQIRDLDRQSSRYNALDDVEKAARLIYLNKTCYNGLFRVNSSGQFNTPYGKYKNPNIVNEVVLRAVSKYFNDNNIQILSGDFADAVANAQKGDFVYLDPPYDPVSNTASFTGYNEGGFNKKEQERLKLVCDELNKKGVKFLLSNSNTEFINNLYKGYDIIIVKAKRSINSNGNKRGEVEEVLIKNF